MADSHDPALKTLDDDVIATYEQLKVKFAAASNAQKRVCVLWQPQSCDRRTKFEHFTHLKHHMKHVAICI